jgi:hypothetical protein
MACECVKEINEKLASRNTRLTQAIVFGGRDHDGLMLQTEQVESGRGKQKAVAMFLTYCPFCGVKYGTDA